MTTTLTLNGLDAVSVQLAMPFRGVWTAEVDFDLEAIPVLPKGPAILKIGAVSLLGTIDPDASGKFGAKAKARVFGGGGGWHKKVPAQHFTSDAGVLSTAVLAATAAIVGEKVVQAVPSILGVHYTRAAGAASRVLAGLDWYVEPLTGVTIVGPRLPIPAVPGRVEVLEWDPLERRATIATDDLVLPGTVILDSRFGTTIVQDVEQTFASGGARTSAWCGGVASGSRLLSMLSAVAREAIRPEYLRHHSYRVVLLTDGSRYALQALKPFGSIPDLLPIAMCMGVPGFDAKLTPGSEVLVLFADGDPSKPVIVGFVAGNPPPIEVSNNAIRIAFGLGLKPVATAPEVIAAITALSTGLTAVAAALVGVTGTTGSPVPPLLPVHATAAAIAPTAAATALALVTTATATVASIRTWTD